MDSTPPSHKSEPNHLRKSASRLTLIANDPDSAPETDQIPHFSVNFASSRKTPSSNPSKMSIKNSGSLPIKDLLMLSPSPVRKSRARLSDRLEMADDQGELVGSRRRCKARMGFNGLLGCASPRNGGRRGRRRIEEGVREEKDGGNVDEIGKHKKRRNSGKFRKEKLVPSVPSLSVCPNDNAGDQSALNGFGQQLRDLMMWRDVAKTSLWFGFGCLCFLSSCITKELRFSLFSVISQAGLLILVISFFSNALLHQRINSDGAERSCEFKLKEDDVLRVARVVLPAMNLVISKTRELFSGEPSMTLKVASFLLFGAEYGHILTLWRLCALGFFISFTTPKLYSSYSTQIDKAVEHWKSRVLETWRACSHKKTLAASAAAAFWSLTSLRTRVFAAFISLVILRYNRQYVDAGLGVKEEAGAGEEEVTQRLEALIAAKDSEN